MESGSHEKMEADHGDQKRKLACDSCKRKKLKCEWDHDEICNRCSKTGTDCIPQPTQPRKKREKKSNTYLTALEDRLERMEAAMVKQSSTPIKRSSDDLESQALVDHMSVLKIHDNGNATFLGSASGFSIFSPQGLRWIEDKIGNDQFSEIIAKLPNLSEDSSTALHSSMWYPLSPEEREPLPSRAVAASYIDAFFHGFGTFWPLFDRSIFEARFNRQYPVTPEEDVSWYACINILFAIGTLMGDFPAEPTTPHTGREPQKQRWWKWMRNASSCYLDLRFKQASLTAVQAMVAIAFVLQTMSDPHPCSIVAVSALRQAQAIGLHRNITYVGLSHAEFEQRRNTFWIALLLEQGVSFRQGRPSIIHEDDIGVDFPKDTSSNLNTLHLRQMTKLSLLQGRIYNKLYSAKSLTKSTFERIQRIGSLDEELQLWKDSLPIEIRPGHEIPSNSNPQTLAPIIMMHFSYFNALTILHRVSNHHGPWTRKRDNPFGPEIQEMNLNPRVFAGSAICVSAARSIIGLLGECARNAEIGELNIIRVVVYYPLSAALTLFTSVLQNPFDESALKDIELMKSVTSFCERFFGDDHSPDTEFMISTFSSVNRLAEEYVTKSRATGMPGQKRGGGGDVKENSSTASAKPTKQLSGKNVFSSASPSSTPVINNSNDIIQYPLPHPHVPPSTPTTTRSFSGTPERQSIPSPHPTHPSSLAPSDNNSQNLIHPKITQSPMPQFEKPINSFAPSPFADPYSFPGSFQPQETMQRAPEALPFENNPIGYLDTQEAIVAGNVFMGGVDMTTDVSAGGEVDPACLYPTDDFLLPQDGSWFFPFTGGGGFDYDPSFGPPGPSNVDVNGGLMTEGSWDGTGGKSAFEASGPEILDPSGGGLGNSMHNGDGFL